MKKVGKCFSAEFSLVQQRHLDGREMFQIKAIYRNTAARKNTEKK